MHIKIRVSLLYMIFLFLFLLNRVPDNVKEKRFANWLREARDWAISRNRYWGTPIPLWISEDGEEVRIQDNSVRSCLKS